MKAPSPEQLRLLGELSAGATLKDESVLAKAPDWDQLEKLQILSSSAIKAFRDLHRLPSAEQSQYIRETPAAVEGFVEAIQSSGLPLGVVQYLVTAFYNIIRDDTAVLDTMLRALKGQQDKILPVFLQYLARPGLDPFTGDRATFILTSLLPRAPPGFFEPAQVNALIDDIISGQRLPVSPYGRLDCLKNILKQGDYRESVWEKSKKNSVILGNLDETASSNTCLYPAIFCAWLITFNEGLLVAFTREGGVSSVCKVLRHSKMEKVVRVCIRVLLNCLSNDEAVECLIQHDALHILTLLEYEKWRDQELYDEIRKGSMALQQKIKLFSNFDRYCRELDSGQLKWSFLHSEKFWHENVMHFEENEFAAVKKLTVLLKSPDPVTSAVACHDLGEFARLHPTGRRVIQKLKAKEVVMLLMSHKDRKLSREALLCVQKMMLDNWQSAAGTINSH